MLQNRRDCQNMKWRDLWTTSFKENDILAFQPQIWHLAFSAEAVRREAPTIDWQSFTPTQSFTSISCASHQITSQLLTPNNWASRVEEKVLTFDAVPSRERGNYWSFLGSFTHYRRTGISQTRKLICLVCLNRALQSRRDVSLIVASLGTFALSLLPKLIVL